MKLKFPSNFIFLSGCTDFLRTESDRRWFVVQPEAPKSRIRCSAPDPFQGLRGHEYIRARGLDPRVVRQQHTTSDNCQCGPCSQSRLLPAVQNICAARERRQVPQLAVVRWDDPSNETAQALLAQHIGG